MLLGLSLVWALTRIVKARVFVFTLNFVGFLLFIAPIVILMTLARP
jgi:hypothetical protein